MDRENLPQLGGVQGHGPPGENFERYSLYMLISKLNKNINATLLPLDESKLW